eukprot:jgi/Mesvir1/18475/Mv25471-RA.1
MTRRCMPGRQQRGTGRKARKNGGIGSTLVQLVDVRPGVQGRQVLSVGTGSARARRPSSPQDLLGPGVGQPSHCRLVGRGARGRGTGAEWSRAPTGGQSTPWACQTLGCPKPRCTWAAAPPRSLQTGLTAVRATKSDQSPVRDVGSGRLLTATIPLSRKKAENRGVLSLAAVSAGAKRLPAVPTGSMALASSSITKKWRAGVAPSRLCKSSKNFWRSNSGRPLWCA